MQNRLAPVEQSLVEERQHIVIDETQHAFAIDRSEHVTDSPQTMQRQNEIREARVIGTQDSHKVARRLCGLMRDGKLEIALASHVHEWHPKRGQVDQERLEAIQVQ